MNENLIGVSIEPFRGEVEELEVMAHKSWREEYGQASFPNLYRPEFVRFLLKSAPDPRHFIAAYKNGEILAFLANLPRTVIYRQKSYRAILSCLLVSRKEYARQGLATALIREAIKINREVTGYDLALLYLEKGHKSTKLIQKLKAEGENLQFLKNLLVLGRVLDLNRVARSEGLKTWERIAIKLWGADKIPGDRQDDEFVVVDFRPEEGQAREIRNWLNRYSERVDLARFWQDEQELIRELKAPGVSETRLILRHGKPVAVFNYFLHEHLGQTAELWAWLNHVAMDGLSSEEQARALKCLLKHLAESGVIGVIEWNRKYYLNRILYRAKFFPYFRAVNLYAWSFNSELKFDPLKNVYEVQI